jgi:hypothetical protein
MKMENKEVGRDDVNLSSRSGQGLVAGSYLDFLQFSPNNSILNYFLRCRKTR